MKFCSNCESRLVETSEGLKCPKCDDLSQIPPKQLESNKIGELSDTSFPFEKGKYYRAGNIRIALECNKQTGINFNNKRNFLTLLRYAHKPLANRSNPYLDRYESESDAYYYVGQGITGDQTLTGVNLKLAKSDDTNTPIHLFWQHNFNSEHQYIGEMKLEGYEQKIQNDADGKKRKVYVFTLKSIKINL